jgi:hypothetical protein
MTATKNIAYAALLAASALCGPAHAGDAPGAAIWRWSQSGGGNFDVVWSAAAHRPPHGGGVARLSGGGDNAEVVYADTPVLVQKGAGVARLVGGGDNATVAYAAPVPGRAG